ncbi:MAG: hypothetical protein KGK08_05535 [Acidobacteriota bacterium]|nr:hypothetical protein [Acidobacteriota bacterium]
MAAYLVLFAAVLSRILPVTLHANGLNFTAVGGGLLFFGARRSRIHTVAAVLALMASDYWLTVYGYHYAFQLSAYLPTWAWYAAVCLAGHQLLNRKPSAVRVGVAVLASSTSFFLISNLVVWVASGMYAHSLAGLATCFTLAIPFYANDMFSTALTAGALFGLPALATSIAASLREARAMQSL